MFVTDFMPSEVSVCSFIHESRFEVGRSSVFSYWNYDSLPDPFLVEHPNSSQEM